MFSKLNLKLNHVTLKQKVSNFLVELIQTGKLKAIEDGRNMEHRIETVPTRQS